MGAYSAAVAMYRGALEQLLFGEGFSGGMLAQKIAAVEQAIRDGTAPPWALNLEPEYLKVLKDLGNGAIHPNDGDIQRQAVLDQQLMTHVMATFVELLDQVYEEPSRRADRLAALKAASNVLSPSRKTKTP